MKEKKNERCLRSCLLLGLAILLVGCGVSTEGTSVLQMPAESGSRTASGENTESEAADADTKMERNPVETTVILTHTMPESSELLSEEERVSWSETAGLWPEDVRAAYRLPAEALPKLLADCSGIYAFTLSAPVKEAAECIILLAAED